MAKRRRVTADLLYMDFNDSWGMFSSIVIGLIGTAIMIYGKKQTNFKCIGVGLALCIFPYFVSSIAVSWVITAACLGGLWASAKYLPS